MRKIASIIALTVAAVMAAPDEDKIVNLPYVGTPNSQWYSGYLNVNPNKALFYVFVESQDTKNQQTDPVLVWFNGGPGCSSLLALFQEHGPYVYDDGETLLKPNPFPWNSRANVLYIESPAGVGFTYAATDDDMSHNDLTQSEDTLAAIQSFFTKFPEYIKNELWISGESYGGIYVPYLSWQLHQHNLQAQWNGLPQYNFKGFLVGNGATDWNVDINPAFPEVVFNFNLIPEEWEL